MSNELLTAEEQALLDSAVEELLEDNSRPANKISENSKSLLVDEYTSRFSSAVWYENIQKKVIILAGCGGIGSYVGFLLARVKPTSLFIYDDDIVDATNMSGQLYENSSIGTSKVESLFRIINKFSNFRSLFAIPEKFTEDCDAADIMICGFDNMKARDIFFHKWKSHVQTKTVGERAKCLFIDGRLAAEEFQIFCITGDDSYNIDKYENEHLFLDKEAEETICSYKQTSFCANMIASCMVNLFVNFCANEVGAYRDLPFITRYNAETMYFKTES